MSEKYKSRKSEPVYSSTYDNGGWPAKEELPTKDPIGDIDDHTKDAVRYMTAHQAGLNRDEEVDEWVEGYNKWKSNKNIQKNLKCNCGIHAVYGDIPAHNHKDYCDLFKAIKNI